MSVSIGNLWVGGCDLAVVADAAMLTFEEEEMLNRTLTVLAVGVLSLICVGCVTASGAALSTDAIYIVDSPASPPAPCTHAGVTHRVNLHVSSTNATVTADPPTPPNQPIQRCDWIEWYPVVDDSIGSAFVARVVFINTDGDKVTYAKSQKNKCKGCGYDVVLAPPCASGGNPCRMEIKTNLPDGDYVYVAFVVHFIPGGGTHLKQTDPDLEVAGGPGGFDDGYVYSRLRRGTH